MKNGKARELRNVLLVHDREYLRTALGLLSHAEASVDLIAYSFAIGSARGKLAPATAPFEIATALTDLRREKDLRIRVYFEGERETVDRNAVTAAFLKKAGIQVKFGATHAKGLLVDGRYVLFGSTNLTHQSIAKNNETNLLFDEPAVAEGYAKYFAHLWSGGRHGGVTLPRPLLADGEFEPALLEMIDTAQERLEFSIYFFHHRGIEDALVRAAGRGVKIRGFVHDHSSFAMSYVRRTRGTVERMRAAGVRGLYYGPPHLFSHSKYLVKDRREILLGTGNWLDEDVRIHPQLHVRFTNEGLAEALARKLAATIREQGRPASSVTSGSRQRKLHPEARPQSRL